MITLGRNVYLWRVERKLTQDELARRTGISRPNISVVEQGGRDITISTLLRLAKALNINPGILVDGILPHKPFGGRFSRKSFDRMARWILGGKQTLSKSEKRLAELLKPFLERKIAINKGIKPGTLPRTARKEKQNWLSVQAEFHRDDIRNIFSRVDKLLNG